MVAEYVRELLPPEWHAVVGDLPAAKQEVVGVSETSGATSTEYFGAPGSSTIAGPIVQVVIRSRSYPQGRERADTTKDTLHRYHDDKLLGVWAVGSPVYLGRNAEKLHEFLVTFRLQVKE